MPASPDSLTYPDRMHESSTADRYSQEESAASILQSVKEQEAQFEQLTRELEAERQTVAQQLEKCRLGSETASLSSISSTDESFHWRRPPLHESVLEDESETESRVSGSQLVDSCLRVLEQRGIMNAGDGPGQPLGSEVGYPPHSAPSYADYQEHDMYSSRLSNGPVNAFDRTQSPNHSLQSGTSLRSDQRAMPVKIHGVDPGRLGSRSQLQAAHSPVSSQGPGTPTRLNSWSANPALYEAPPVHDSFDTRHYDDSYSSSQYALRDGRVNDYHSASQEINRHGSSHLNDNRYDNPTYASVPRDDEGYQQSPRSGPEYGGSVNSSFQGRPPLDSDHRQSRDHLPPANGPYSGSQRLNDSDPYGRLPPPPPEDPYSRGNDSYRGRDETDLRRSDAGEEGMYSGSMPPPESRFNGQPPFNDRYRTDPPYSDSYRGDRPGDDQYRPEVQGGGRFPDPRLDDSRQGPDDPYGDSRAPPGDEQPRYMPEFQSQQRGAPSPRPGSDRPGYDDQSPYDRQGPYNTQQPYRDYNRDGPEQDSQQMSQPHPDILRHSPSVDSQGKDQRFRNPDLQEVIEFLSHPSNSIKANAAAYLQHLCYMKDDIKSKARALGAIHALVQQVNNEIPEVHRNACGALRNLSYGRANDENKRAIKNAGGIPALVRLLRKTPHNDIRELVTGILWNLSSCQDLKKAIIDEGLTVLINTVVIPHSGWDRSMDPKTSMPQNVYWSTVFRNASGVLRNISSAGPYARKKLRECEGLVEAVLFIVKAAIGKNDIDNKSVENCVCLLRNLSYACQEVGDPQYLARRQPKKPPGDKENTGCFGISRKKKDNQKDPNKVEFSPYIDTSNQNPGRGMHLLWSEDIVHVYLPLLTDCTNSETLEAAAGAIQNLAACEWEPSILIRTAVRVERGLPIIVELLDLESDKVVHAAATALRNLALDPKNKDLIGKYAMKQLAQKLPSETKTPSFPISDDTISAVEAAIYEVIKSSPEFAHLLLKEDGVTRLVYITRSRGRFSPKVSQYASALLFAMWQFKELHMDYKRMGFREQHFVSRTMAARGGPRPDATLGKPHMDQSGHGTQNTLPPVTRLPPGGDYRSGQPEPTYPLPSHHSPNNNREFADPIESPYSRINNRMHDRDPYDDRDGKLRPDEVPMTDMGAPPATGPYGTMDGRPLGREDMGQPYGSVDRLPPPARDDYRPPGGVPLFPPTQQPQPQADSREPLYAQVNKNMTRKRQEQSNIRLGGSHPPDAADSWV